MRQYGLPQTARHLIISLITMYLVVFIPGKSVETGLWWFWLVASVLAWGIITWINSRYPDFTPSKTKMNGCLLAIAGVMTYILIAFPIEEFIGLIMATGAALLYMYSDESEQQSNDLIKVNR
ncbi:hypothetical protein [Vibrio genomosp. F6]|uniref:Uncharacterized protein n=1 Tax=Vibrio genomosp. F6 str. FF-238 TaxID=1191298 RepID=A0A1E5CSM0_9VIBR|nr:hypothetical protein [Vibrio genomosp. F6]OEE72848.1 hypothetical protein A130_07200 [Vibrio genomosp. F6 str. FF-238]